MRWVVWEECLSCRRHDCGAEHVIFRKYFFDERCKKCRIPDGGDTLIPDFSPAINAEVSSRLNGLAGCLEKRVWANSVTLLVDLHEGEIE